MRQTRIGAFEALWLCEAVRLREEQLGPLEDSEANRRAIAAGGDLSQRLTCRALWLAERDGQAAALRAWLQGARLAFMLLMGLALLSGAGLALGVLGDGLRPVNLFWALGSLLGIHALMLLLWLLSLTSAKGLIGGLGHLWLWLTGRLVSDAQAAQLVAALLVLLDRQRLSRWLLGMLVHACWLLLLSTALGVLLVQLSIRRYGFVWETTLLSTETFVHLTQSLAVLPAWLGFPPPDAALIRASAATALADEAARQTWAVWLLGVLLIYGVLPRGMLWLFCLWRWRQARAKLTLDLHLPGYVLLRERLMPASQRLGVTDAAPQRLMEAQAQLPAQSAGGALLVSIELWERPDWPPALPEQVLNAGNLDEGAQRRQLLAQLTEHPPARLLIACDPRRSPDRGTLRLIAELSRCAAATRVWLLAAPSGEVLDNQRLEDWQAAITALQLAYQGATLDWLGSGNG